MLEEVGLKPREPQDRLIERIDLAGAYSRLGYIGAYVINAENEEQAKDAESVLEKDYYIVPNVSLNLPGTLRTEIRGGKRNTVVQWPEVSGIIQAHDDGIKGGDVRVLVLDTGCDADRYNRILLNSMRSALKTLVEDFDVLPIVASGNDGDNHLRAPGFFPEVLAVGAVDFNARPAEFTSTGQMSVEDQLRTIPDVWGYGVNVYSSLERNSDNRSKYALKSGTSMAAPYVTGIAALYAQVTGLQGEALKRRILETALGDPRVARFVES